MNHNIHATKWHAKMELPDLVAKAVISACSSGRKLSWKIQESEKGTLIQLVWKAANSFTGDTGKKTEVCSNWNNSPVYSNRQSIVQKPQRNPPSRVRRNARRLKAFIECKQTTQEYREVSESGKCDSGNTNQDSSAKEDGSTAGPGMVSYHRPSHAYLPKLKLPSLSLDFQESVQASIESEPTKVGSATSQPGKLLQETPPKPPSLPPDSQKITPAIVEENAAQISDVQTLKDILYNAYDVRFEVRDDTPCLLYKEQEEEKWVPIRVLKDVSDDSDEE